MGSGSTSSVGDTPNSMGANLTPLDFGPDFNVSATSGGGGGYHHCVVADDSSFKCWGWNEDGQLGLGDEEDRGDESSEMGVYLSFVQFDFTAQPTRGPTTDPTADPTEKATDDPTDAPYTEPTANPTGTPSSAQSSLKPSPLPTVTEPTLLPTLSPTWHPLNEGEVGEQYPEGTPTMADEVADGEEEGSELIYVTAGLGGLVLLLAVAVVILIALRLKRRQGAQQEIAVVDMVGVSHGGHQGQTPANASVHEKEGDVKEGHVKETGGAATKEREELSDDEKSADLADLYVNDEDPEDGLEAAPGANDAALEEQGDRDNEDSFEVVCENNDDQTAGNVQSE